MNQIQVSLTVRSGCHSRAVDDEAIVDVVPLHALEHAIDILHRDHFDVGDEAVLGAEVQHLLRFRDAADQCVTFRGHPKFAGELIVPMHYQPRIKPMVSTMAADSASRAERNNRNDFQA